jgi:uncharacterized protein
LRIALLDVNVLLALAWPNHVHHRAAHEWFGSNQRYGWATCPVTQAGFIRVSSNPRVSSQAKAPAEAVALLREIVRLPRHRFWSDDVSLTQARFVSIDKVFGHAQVSDAHLLELALRHAGRLATFDRGISSLLSRREGQQEAIVVVAA